MKLLEVTRPSDKAAERAKIAAKEEAMRKRVVVTYTRALTANKIFQPHPVDVEKWLFGGGPQTDLMDELVVWTDAIGYLVKVKPNDKEAPDHETAFRTFSNYLDIPHDMVDFVCNGGQLEVEEK